MTMLEIIRNSIKREQEKVNYINSSVAPQYSLEMILLRIMYLKRLEDEEIIRLTKLGEITSDLAENLHIEIEESEVN